MNDSHHWLIGFLYRFLAENLLRESVEKENNRKGEREREKELE